MNGITVDIAHLKKGEVNLGVRLHIHSGNGTTPN